MIPSKNVWGINKDECAVVAQEEMHANYQSSVKVRCYLVQRIKKGCVVPIKSSLRKTKWDMSASEYYHAWRILNDAVFIIDAPRRMGMVEERPSYTYHLYTDEASPLQGFVKYVHNIGLEYVRFLEMYGCELPIKESYYLNYHQSLLAFDKVGDFTTAKK
jgi:hypothetical protein